MASKRFKGLVWTDIVEVRFPYSGKITNVTKTNGDYVKRGELLAALDKKLLQAQLDLELADYERQRSEFEIFVSKNSSDDQITKHLKAAQQADLNASVKAVEIAKIQLDQADLFSPVEGQVLDDGGNIPGIFVTPASSTFKIANYTKLRVRIKIDSKDWEFLREPRKAIINGATAITTPIYPSLKFDHFIVDFALEDPRGLQPGLFTTVVIG